MIAVNGTTKISLTKEDLTIAVRNFLNNREYYSNGYSVEDLKVHREGSKYAVTALVSANHKKGVD